MSTRASIHFQSDGSDVAIVYRHSDGYPEGLGEDLKAFFAEVRIQCGHDTRFNDPSYLAAKWIVWDAKQHGEGLKFLSVGVLLEDPSDIAYRYILACDDDQEPKVKIETAR